jgi:multiple sugar transport system substrate-binding protein
MRKSKWLVLLVLLLFTAVFFFAGKEKEGAKEKGAPKVASVIKILSIDYPNTRAELEIKGEFEAETGITVEYQLFPYLGAHDKIKLALATKDDTFDIYQYDSYFATGLNMMEGFQPMDEFIADPDLPDIDPESFVPNSWEPWGLYKGQCISIPTLQAIRLFGYRTDLFNDPKEKANFKKQYGYELTPPDTWEQLADVAKFFTRDTDGDGERDFWGFCGGFANNPAWDSMADTYLSFKPIKGEDYWFDKDYNILFDNDKCVKAIQYWTDAWNWGWLDPGAVKRDYGAIRDLFDAGKTAMTLAWHDEFQYTETNPIVKGKVGYKKIPKWKDGVYHAQIAVQQYAINKYTSKDRQISSYKYLYWIKTPENDKRQALSEHIKMPDREVNYYDADIIAKQPYTDEVIENYKVGYPIPLIAEQNEFAYLFGQEIQAAMLGQKTAREAVKSAARQMKEMFEQAGYYK